MTQTLQQIADCTFFFSASLQEWNDARNINTHVWCASQFSCEYFFFVAFCRCSTQSIVHHFTLFLVYFQFLILCVFIVRDFQSKHHQEIYTFSIHFHAQFKPPQIYFSISPCLNRRNHVKVFLSHCRFPVSCSYFEFSDGNSNGHPMRTVICG